MPLRWRGCKAGPRRCGPAFGKSAMLINPPTHQYLLSAAGAAERPNCVVPGCRGIANRRHWALDVTCNADQARNRKWHCAGNRALRRKLAAAPWPGWKRAGALRGKLKRAGWDDGFRISALS